MKSRPRCYCASRAYAEVYNDLDSEVVTLAARLGSSFIGIEIEQRWFDAACRRIEAEARQVRLPLDEPTRGPVQEALL